MTYCVIVCYVPVATTDYIIGTTNIMNGVGLINSVLADTPHFKSVQLWDNQMDDPSSSAGIQVQSTGQQGRPARQRGAGQQGTRSMGQHKLPTGQDKQPRKAENPFMIN